MAKYNIVTDKTNNFFTNNKLNIANSQPTTGSWAKGDVVISGNVTDSIFGWVCTAAGTPGTWMKLKSSDELTGDNNVTTHYHDSRYYQKSEVDNKLNGKSNTDHLHDSRYYQKSEVDNRLNGKSNTDHNHNSAYVDQSGDTMTGNLTAPSFYATNNWMKFGAYWLTIGQTASASGWGDIWIQI